MKLSLNEQQKTSIIKLLAEKLDEKLIKYGRESSSMPFLARLIQDNEKIAAYSFIHSMATTLGMSIYEEVSVILAKENSEESFRNIGVGGLLSDDQKSIINSIVKDLRNGDRKADIEIEMQEILRTSSENGTYQKSGDVADFYMKRDGQEYYFEIKTSKPNIDIFEKSKTKLLEWIARKRKPVKVFLVFPYNPYHPKPYSRFTESGMMDHPNDFLIGEEYWNFIGGKNTFPELLETFDEVGKEFKNRIEKKFKEIAKDKIDSY